MLEEVRIQGLGVIDDAVLELHPGLTVVTGETGAGKTMVVTGLGLLFGGRADAGRVRPGARRTAVEGTVTIDPESPAAVRASDAGGEIEDGTLIVTRTVSSEGRSRAYVGGRAAPVGLLAELADDLIAVHGQADQQRLLRPARQRSSLDRFAGPALAHALPRYEHGYARHREVDRKLGELTTASRERAREVDLLRLGLAEIEQADPSPREDDELDAEAERLRHADVLRTAATTAHEALLGDPTGGGGADAVGLVGTAREAVESVQSHDPELAGLANRLAEAGYLLSDIAGDLASYMENIDVDPARLAAVEERRAVLGGLTRKYGDDVSTVLA
ncbi:MAG: AAA family ATPase, partial [Streptosporangiaceae bacterium]